MGKSFHSGCMSQSVQWWFQKGPCFPLSPFVFHVGPSSFFYNERNNSFIYILKSKVDLCSEMFTIQYSIKCST